LIVTLLGVVEPTVRAAGVAVTVMAYVVTGTGGFGVLGVPEPFGSVGELDWQPTAKTRASPKRGRMKLFKCFIPVLLMAFTWSPEL
jgi:hypothetical protein